jgi:hypothetical protein
MVPPALARDRLHRNSYRVGGFVNVGRFIYVMPLRQWDPL